jgi:RND family efflux transporter MFP subunit
MKRKIGLPLLAIIGVSMGLMAVIASAKKTQAPPIPFAPPSPPYAHYIAAAGTIEASTENVDIGTSIAEVVTEVYVIAGDRVKQNDPLLKLDTRTFEAELLQAEMDRAQAVVEYENQKTQLNLYDRLTDRRAVSENDYNQVYFAVESAKVAIAQADANIEVAQSYIERSTLRAPTDGEVLQVKIRVGEVANLNPFNQLPLITFGPVCPTNVRIDIDEEDAWRFKKGAPAMGYVRGNSSIRFPLTFVRLEPLLVPKQSLTGSTSEQTDTRVLQVIYSFTCRDLPVYVGQFIDVYIEAIPADTRYDSEKMRAY